jgi:hypothetical protein
MNLMIIVLLVAGIGLLLGGLLTVGIGIQLELSFGNTLILSGAIVACTGVMTLGLWIALRELKSIARQLGSGLPAESRAAGASASAGLGDTLGDQAPEDGGFLFSRDQPAAAQHPDYAEAVPPAPWLEQAASRDRGRGDAPAVPASVEAAPAPKPRRNLLFSSTLRKERERAEARSAERSATELRPGPPGPAPAAQPAEAPPATFDDAWPKSERSRTAEAPPPRHSGRAPSTFTEAGTGAAEHQPPAAGNEETPPVTVLKSGVVDGMAYSLYSDGSIEAQMPEGMMRFASIDELRAHLDQRS